jgi:hypothetical protein
MATDPTTTGPEDLTPDQAVALVRRLSGEAFAAVRDAIAHWDEADLVGEAEAAEVSAATGRRIPPPGR